MSKKLRIGVIGAGRIGKLHANNLVNRVPNAELAAISEGLLKKNRICAGKSLSIHGKAVWHGILELTASFAFGNTTIWFPDENVPGN